MVLGCHGARGCQAAGGGRAECAVRTGVVGSGRRGRCRGRGRGRRGAVRGVRPPVQQRVQPAPARAAHPRGAAGGVRHVRPLLQDAAVSPPPHAGATPARAPASQAAAAPRAAARPELPTVAALAALAALSLHARERNVTVEETLRPLLQSTQLRRHTTNKCCVHYHWKCITLVIRLVLFHHQRLLSVGFLFYVTYLIDSEGSVASLCTAKS